MGSRLRVLLVRHGQSEANINWDVNKRKADHAISLTEIGHAQAKKAGEVLADWIAGRLLNSRLESLSSIRLWCGPYLRTRQTAQRIFETCRLSEGGKSPFLDEGPVESFMLHEQLFGIFDGLSDEERAEKYPSEWEHYQKCKSFEGKVWARPPGGESRMDVAVRIHQAFGTFQRDFDRHGIETVVVVAHGTVNRAFTMAWCHHPWEFLEKEPNPNNCSIRLLEDGCDRGYIFDGFPP